MQCVEYRSSPREPLGAGWAATEIAPPMKTARSHHRPLCIAADLQPVLPVVFLGPTFELVIILSAFKSNVYYGEPPRRLTSIKQVANGKAFRQVWTSAAGEIDDATTLRRLGEDVPMSPYLRILHDDKCPCPTCGSGSEALELSQA